MTTELQVIREPDLMQLALEHNAPVETVERLAALKEHLLEREAEAEFNSAMHRCQEKMRRIGADANNPQTKSRYASYTKLDSVLRPIYTAENFSLSFNTEPIDRADTLRILCYVSHRTPGALWSHTRKYTIDMPADGKGAKGGDVMTKTHATGAAAAYGMRYLLKMIFNVAVGETDDDGNGAADKGDRLDDLIVQEWIDAMRQASDHDSLKRIFADCWNRAKKLNDQAAKDVFQKVYEAQKRSMA